MSDLIKTRKGIFIPDITVEMFRNASLEAVEELLVSGEMQDIILPSAEPERLSDDDFETIRIHLNAQKEKLCNQRRWEEAEEYQRIIDRFMAFASAELEYSEQDVRDSFNAGYACGMEATRPERKKGKWIDETFKPWGLVYHPYKCDQCGEHSEADSNFCPNCGAYMRGDKDEDR